MKKAPGHRPQTDDRERCIYPAHPSKVEPFLKVKVRRQIVPAFDVIGVVIDLGLVARKLIVVISGDASVT